MKNNNQYLEKINESVSGQVVDERKPNNWYLRSIAKSTGSEIHGHRTDNYYLKRIALNLEDMDITELLETITELRGEIDDLENQLKNDIHLFGCNDIVQTGGSLDLFAYCKADDVLEGNTVYFYAITESTTSSITVTSDKSAISYSSSEKATLTITTLDENDDPLSNQTVTIKNGSTILDTVQTGVDGTVEYEYTSQGIGDVTLTIECGEVSETFTIEDCFYYNPNTMTSSQVLSIPNFPVNFKATFKTQYVDSSASERKSYFIVGEDANNHISFGQLANIRERIIKTIDRSEETIASESILVDTKEYFHEFTYENGNLTLKVDNTTLTGTYDYNKRDYVAVYIDSANKMSELKIKPL